MLGTKQWFVALLTLLAYASPGLGHAEQQQPSFQVLTDVESQAITVFRDSVGFLWIGTYVDGLYRFDGKQLKRYGPDSGLIETSSVQAVLEDTQGKLWIAASGGGLSCFDRESNQVKKYTYDSGMPNGLSSNAFFWGGRYTLIEDRRGDLWIATIGGGLNRFHRKTETFTHFRHDSGEPGSISSDSIRTLHEDSAGAIWLGTEQGLNKLNPVTGEVERFEFEEGNLASLSSNTVMSIFEDSTGTLWIGTEAAGLNRFDEDNGTFQRYQFDPADPLSIGSNLVLSIFEDVHHTLWFCHQSGLSFLEYGSDTFHRYEGEHVDFNMVLEDSITGEIWALTDSGRLGKMKLSEERFKLYRPEPGNPNSLGSEIVVTIYEDKNDILWISCLGGLNSYNRATGRFQTYLHDPSDPGSIQSPMGYTPGIFEDRNGTFWLGNSLPGSISIFDRATGRVVRTLTHNPADPEGLPDVQQVNRFREDHDDPSMLWIATANGLIRFDTLTEEFRRFGRDDSWDVLEDDGGILWVATFGDGLAKFDKHTEQFEYFRHDPEDPASISDNALVPIFRAADGRLWIGTENGLNLLHTDTGTFTRYMNSDGYPWDAIHSIGEDRQGNLWLGTNNGLARLSPDSGEFRHYTQADGIQGSMFYANNGIMTRSGEMWFGGTKGMNSFNPEQISDNPNIPVIVLSSLTQAGEDVDFGTAPERLKRITLDWQNNFFEFEFVALDFAKPEKNQYAYMLEGIDSNWFYSGTRNFGRYSGLAPGTYILRLKGSNNDSVWNEQGVDLEIIVLPPFWRTGWFYSLVILIGLLIFLAVAVSMARLRVEIGERKRSELALLESERQLKSHISNTPMGVIHWNRNFEVTAWNPAAETIFGYKAEFAIGRHANDLLIPENAKNDVDEVWIALVQQSGGNRSINENRTKQGRTIVCDWYNTPLVDEDGRVNGVASMVADITERRVAEKALKSSEEKYRLLADNATDLIWTADLDGNITYVSPSVTVLRGFAVEEALKQTIFDSLSSVSSAGIRERLASELALETDPTADPNRSATLSTELFRKDGSKFWAEVKTTFLRDASGRPSGLLGITRDISERRQAEEMLSDVAAGFTAATGKEFFRSLAQHIAVSLDIDYVLIGQLAPDDTGRIDTVAVCAQGHIVENMSYDLAGTPCSNVVAGDICFHPSNTQVLFPDDVLLVDMGVESYMGIPLWRSSGEPLGLLALLHKEGFPNAELASSMLKIFGVRASAELERMQSEENTQRLVTAIEQSVETVMITDVDGKIEYVNPAFERITGYRSEEVIGKKPSIQSSGTLDSEIYEYLWRTISSGEVWKGQFTNRRKDGSLFHEEATITPVFDKTGRIVNYVAVKRNVTKELQLEQQLRQTQKLEAIGTLAGGIAHDFNNVLFAILGNADLAFDSIPEDHPAAESLYQIVSAGNRATELVKQILTFARKTEKSRHALQVTAIVQEAAKLLRATLPATIEIIQKQIGETADIYADPTEIHQTVMNLCTNAGHAMMESGGKLEISLCETQVDESTVQQNPELGVGPFAVLSVSDTGPGIPQEVLEHIFEPFYTTKEAGEGTGMGLAVVHGIVKDLGGAITVYSEIGIGTTFKVYLPILDADQYLEEEQEEDQIPRGNEHVLVVDDEPAIAKMLSSMLQGLGYTVSTFSSSSDALETYLSTPEMFDIVITDQTMPTMTGAELAAAIIAHNKTQAIILCTGFSQTMSKEKAESVGVDAFVSKPISKKGLAVTIRQVLDHQLDHQLDH